MAPVRKPSRWRQGLRELALNFPEEINLVYPVHRSPNVREPLRLLDDLATYAAMANRVNPYGDGTARRRIVTKILVLGHVPNAPRHELK